MLDKWVDWALSKTTINPDGTYRIPSTLQWSGQPDTWNASSPGANTGLHVTVADYTNDVGVAGGLRQDADLLRRQVRRRRRRRRRRRPCSTACGANYQDDAGIAVPETRADYNRFDDPVYVPSGWTGTMPNGDTDRLDVDVLLASGPSTRTTRTGRRCRPT